MRAVARSVGVPEFWIDDATQDMALALWKDGRPHDTTAVRREAIDAARRYGQYSRRRVVRPAFVPLDEALDVEAPGQSDIELRDAVSSAFGALTARQLAALRRRLSYLPMSNLDSAHARAARRNLKRQLRRY